MSWQIHVFGVRHLSPMGAWQLRAFLDRIRPEVVLIEGLADAGRLIPDITRRETRPPIAILAYTDALPVRTLVYPFATYSPEYQAIRWAAENDAQVEFIDLPSERFLGLQDLEVELHARRNAQDQANETDDEPPTDAPVPDSAVPEPRSSLYQRMAILAGEHDYETYWERHFEHNSSNDSYRRAAFEFGRAIRELEEDKPRWRAENIVREAFMRRLISETEAACDALLVEAAATPGHPPLPPTALERLRQLGAPVPA